MTSPPRSAEHGNLSAFERFTRAVEWPMAILALTVVPALVLENRSATPEIARAALTVNWIIWTGFCGEYLVKLALAPRRSAYVREAWFDLVIILFSPPFLVPDAFQSIRSLRAVRIIRLIRLVRALAVAGMGLRLLRPLATSSLAVCPYRLGGRRGARSPCHLRRGRRQ